MTMMTRNERNLHRLERAYIVLLLVFVAVSGLGVVALLDALAMTAW